MSVASKASRAAPGSCASLPSLLVTKTSPRSSPDLAMASPTPASLPYISAVSMCRYPALRAVLTAAAVSFGSTWKTPKPNCGMAWPLFSVMLGMEVTGRTLLSRYRGCRPAHLPRSGRATHQRGLVPSSAAWARGPPLDYDAVVTTPLAQDEPRILRSDTIGHAWLAVAGQIVAGGVPSRYDGLPVREISLVTLAVTRPDPDDEVIARHADPERLAWMHANFTDHSRVAALGGADSYATRLFDYEHSGRDQVMWVIDRLRADPASRSAAITTFQPRTDTAYIPCVSMLDFWLPGGAVELVVYAHSIDFGAKGYGNLVELASLQRHVADALGLPAGRLLMIVKSAHVYETELAYIKGVLAAVEPAWLTAKAWSRPPPGASRGGRRQQPPS